MTITIDDLTIRQRKFLKKHNALKTYLKDVNEEVPRNAARTKDKLRRDEWDFIDRTLIWSHYAFDWSYLYHKAAEEYNSINIYEISDKLEIL